MAIKMPVFPFPPSLINQTTFDILPPLKRRFELETPRLRLRRWRESDMASFIDMNLNGDVRRYFASMPCPVLSLGMIEQFERKFDSQGYSFWAIEHRDSGDFIGTAGFYRRDMPRGLPAMAIGWQLVPQRWGCGYGEEAAQALIEDARARLHLKELVAVIEVDNLRSQRLAEKLGMVRDAELFAEDGHAQAIYRLRLHKRSARAVMAS